MHKRDLLFPGILTLKGLGITAALHMNSWSVLYKRHGLWDNGVGCGKALTLGESRLVPDGRNQLCLKGTHCPGSRLGGSHHVLCLSPSSFQTRIKHPRDGSCPSAPSLGLVALSADLPGVLEMLLLSQLWDGAEGSPTCCQLGLRFLPSILDGAELTGSSLKILWNSPSITSPALAKDSCH